MIKDNIYASTLNQIAKVITITTSYDNKFNRPESIESIKEYKCRVARKSNAYGYNGPGNISLSSQLRCYLEVDVDIKTGMTIEIEGIKYKAGLVYRPNNHHTEIDINNTMEA